MQTPSSTVQAATMASAAVTVLWEMVMLFTTFEPSSILIGGTITLATGIVGYMKKENVLKLAKK